MIQSPHNPDTSDAPEMEGEPLLPEDAVGTDDRRGYERVELSRKGWLAELDDEGKAGLEVSCELVDISRSGFGVECRRMVREGQVIRLQLAERKSRAGKDAKDVYLGTVRSCRYIGRGVHMLGVQYTSDGDT